MKLRPKFSVRTLAILVAIICAYFGAWEATKKYGLLEDSRFSDSPMPFVMSMRSYESEIDYRIEYYLWFFGAQTESPVYSSNRVEQFNIGMTLRMDAGSLLVMEVIPGGSADNNGLQKGDLIQTIDGKDITEMPVDDVSKALKGNEGSPVIFGVIDRDGNHREIRVVRRTLNETALRRFYR